MGKRLFFLFSCLMALPAFALEVTNLRTEDYHNPVGIDRSSIHLSWQLQSEQRGVMQTSYSWIHRLGSVVSSFGWYSSVVGISLLGNCSC